MSRRLSKLSIITGREGRTFRSLLPGFFGLTLACIFLIGGCNNNGSNPNVDARTIGSIDGAVVSALKQAFTLREWQEGDPDGHIYLNGSRVASLSDAEQEAVNDAYQMGYLVGLVDADIDQILEMHEVLGLDPIFADNGTLDLLAFSREFNVSGIRYFIMRPYLDGPIPEDLNLDRVAALDDWAQISSSSVSPASVDLRNTGAPSELTSLADSTSWTEHGTWPAATDPNLSTLPVDLQVTLSGFAQAWSVHSTSNNNDFYYLRTNYVLTPTSTLGQLGSVCNEPACDLFTLNNCPGPAALAGEIGVVNYSLNNTQPAFNNSELDVLVFNPTTTTGEVTTSNSIAHTFSDNVSYSEDDGAEVGVSSSSTYSHSTSYESPSVTTTAFIGSGTNMNNTEWVWSVENSNVSKATFEPNFQWIWEAQSSTRSAGSITWEQEFKFESYAYSCAPVMTTQSIPVLKMVIPVPPLPKECSANSDCGPAQVCGMDLSPPICVGQPCDDMMTCPGGFQCVNEVCQPTG